MALKWQQVAIGGFVSLFFLLGGILNLSGMSYSHDGDKYCSDCYSEIRVNSTYWVVKVGYYDDEPVIFKKVSRSRTLHINLDKIDELVETDPDLDVEILKPTTKKYATINHPKYGYLRPLKHGDTLIYRNNKNRRAPSRIILHGQKDISQTIKWNFDLEHFLMKDINIDPIWKGYNITKLCDWETQTHDVHGNVTYENTCQTDYYNFTINPKIANCYNYIYYPNNDTYLYTLNFSNSFEYGHKSNKTIYWNKWEKIGEKEIQYCQRHIGYKIDNKIINWSKHGYHCSRDDLIIQCDRCGDDGNCNGILTSGESGCIFELISGNIAKSCSGDTPKIRNIMRRFKVR